jgi:hypothetical protein
MARLGSLAGRRRRGKVDTTAGVARRGGGGGGWKERRSILDASFGLYSAQMRSSHAYFLDRQNKDPDSKHGLSLWPHVTAEDPAYESYVSGIQYSPITAARI